MCGRYTDTKRDKQFLVGMGLQADFAFSPRYNIAPTQEASIIVQGASGALEQKRARWGLIPPWAKDEKIGNSLVNARSETVATKPAFRAAYRNRRCLVLTDGFYEWQKRPDGKQPIYIRLRGQPQFVFGGLWEQWDDGNRFIESFCLITVEPNELCSTVHDRMPLILSEADCPGWIDACTPSEALNQLLKPYPAGEMECFPVSTIVNSAWNESPACNQPFTPPEQLSFC